MQEKEIYFDISGYVQLTYPNKVRCFRNDGSVLWKIGEGYKSSCIIMLDEISRCFENDDCNSIFGLIFPFYFNFRHYIEVSLKAIFLWATHSKYENTHDLLKLYDSVETALSEICNKREIWNENITEEMANENLRKIKGCLADLKQEIDFYLSIEPAVEYYRFAFGTKNELIQDVIGFDYEKECGNFQRAANAIETISKYLSIIVYVCFL